MKTLLSNSQRRAGLSLLTGLFALALLLTTVWTVFAAAPIYVRPDGNDTNCNGTVDAAYPGSGGPGLACAVATIQKGIELVDAGGTVNVAAGSYAPSVTITKPVTLRGAQAGVDARDSRPGAAESIITKGGAGTFVLNSTDITFDGFKFSNMAGRTLDTYFNTHNFTMRNCILQGNSGTYTGGSIQFGGGSSLQANGLLFEQNLVLVDKGYLLYMGHSMDNGTIRNNKFNGDSVSFGPFGARTGWLIEGNEFDGNVAGHGPYWGFGLNASLGDVVIRNNVVRQMSIGLGQLSVVDGEITGNTFDDNEYAAFQLWGGEWGSVVSANVLIENNLIKYNGLVPSDGTFGTAAHGIRLRPGEGVNGPIDASTIHMHENAFIDLGVGAPGLAWAVRQQGSGTLDAENNWWNTTDGAVIAAMIGQGSADYDPWIVSYADDPGKAGQPGFWPLALCSNDCYVDAVLGNDTYPGTSAYPFRTITKGINMVEAGGTVHVTAGTYAERLSVSKSVVLRGAQDGVDPTTSGARTNPADESVIDITGLTVNNPNVAVEIPAGVSSVTISGFTIKGSPTFHYADETVFRVWSNNVTIQDNIIDGYYGILDKGGNNSLFSRNRITVNKTGITLQPNPGSFLTVSGNQIIPGPSPASDAAGIYLGSCTDCSVTGNTVNGFSNSNGIGGSNNTRLMISGNTFNGDRKGINLWGNTTFVTVENNTITNSGVQGINIKGQDITITGNTITNNAEGIEIDKHTLDTQRVEIHNNNLSGNTGYGLEVTAGVLETVDAENNWWGSACGPGSAVAGNVDYSPWWGDAAMTVLVAGPTGGVWSIPAGATTEQQQAIISCAAGGTVTYEGSPVAGGVVINSDGLTINLNGATVGPGSPAYTVNADNVTINGPGTLDGNNTANPGILVNAGVDNLIVQNLEITRWTDGVEIAGNVTNLKIVSNWIHRNGTGLKVNPGVTVDQSGTGAIEGNLFKENTTAGVDNQGTTDPLDVTYNSWGAYSGPYELNGNPGGAGDDVLGGAAYYPWTFAELFLDVAPDTLATSRTVSESTSFNVALKADAQTLNGVSFRFTYDPTLLTLNSATPSGSWNCTSASSAGVVDYYCVDFTGSVSDQPGTVMTFNFTASGSGLSGNGPWTNTFDIAHLEAETSAGATGGVKVFVNNAGYDTPGPRGDISDTNDGQIMINGIAQFSGYIDLQGRTNDSGATIRVYNSSDVGTAIQYAQATSASSGQFTTALTGSNLLVIGSTYYFQVDARFYLPTTQTGALAYNHNKALTARPATLLSTVILLGGDATDNNQVDLDDATTIGSLFGSTGVSCPVSGACADVNGDGKVDLYDLVLMGGNYNLDRSLWSSP